MERFKFAGQTLRTKSNIGKDVSDKEFIAEDYWINISPYRSWMISDGAPAALLYAVRIGCNGNNVPLDNNVVYGKIDHLGYLIHESELILPEE